MTPNALRFMCQCGMYYLALNGETECDHCTDLREQIAKEDRRVIALDPYVRAQRKAAKIEEWRQTHRDRYLEAKRIRQRVRAAERRARA